MLTRSNLAAYNAMALSRLADLLPAEEKRQTKAFKDLSHSYLHLDTAQIHLGGGKWYLIAIELPRAMP